MSAVSSEGGDGSGDFDLNLAPIIDCFTVLITYLLVSASFISLSIFDVGIATSSDSASVAAKTLETPVVVVLRLERDNNVIVKVSGGPSNLNQSFPYPPVGNAWDTAGVSKKLAEIKTQYPSVKDATLTAEPTVTYRNIVQVIEQLRKVVPKIYVGS